MKRVFSRTLAAMAAFSCAAMSMAGTLVLKSPTEGAFLGQSNSIQFAITDARVEVTVTATITGPSGTTTLTDTFTPDAEGKIDGALSVNFAEGTPTGEYTVTLSATEQGNTYEDQVSRVQVDVERPRFASFNPNNGSFVKDVVKIRAKIVETNLRDWRVRVNGQDIPNNTGVTNDVVVDWNTAQVRTDGPNTITILVRDLANNERTQTISVTLDRLRPSINIVYPRSDTRIIPGTTVNVTLDVTDASTTSITGNGIDVLVKRMDGTVLGRVSRTGIVGAGEKTLRWIGRISPTSMRLPSQFKITVTAVDRAGNAAVPQEVTVTLRR